MRCGVHGEPWTGAVLAALVRVLGLDRELGITLYYGTPSRGCAAVLAPGPQHYDTIVNCEGNEFRHDVYAK